MKILDSSKARVYDKLVPEVPFDQELYDYTLQKKLRVGVIKNIDDIITLEKESLNAYEDSKEAFIKDGHEIVEFEFNELFEFVINGLDILNNEGLPLVLDEMFEKGDALNANIQTILFMYNKMPKFLKSILGFIAGLFLPRTVSAMFKILHPSNTSQLSKMTKYRYNKIQELADTFVELKLDVLLTPGYQTPAFEIAERANHDLPPFNFILFNMLHLPTCAGKFYPLTL